MNTPTARRLTVEGEVFEVRQDENRRGSVHFDWVSGPNPGYGFSSWMTGAISPDQETDEHPAISDETLAGKIRWFLSQIDPTTGYMAD